MENHEWREVDIELNEWDSEAILESLQLKEY